MEGSSLVMVDGYPWVGGTSPEGSDTSLEGSYYSLYYLLPMSTTLLLPSYLLTIDVPLYHTTVLLYPSYPTYTP